MTRKREVIGQIFRLLAIIETEANHSIISRIRGLLNELSDM